MFNLIVVGSTGIIVTVDLLSLTCKKMKENRKYLVATDSALSVAFKNIHVVRNPDIKIKLTELILHLF